MYILSKLIGHVLGPIVTNIVGYGVGYVLVAVITILGLSFFVACLTGRGPTLVFSGLVGRFFTGLLATIGRILAFLAGQILLVLSWIWHTAIPAIYRFFDTKVYSKVTGWLHKPLCFISTVLVIVIVII